MDYELYHDESQVEGYWHGMFLVPMGGKKLLIDFLAEARTNARYPYPLGIKRVRRENKVYDCAQAWLTLAVASF